MKPLFSIIVPIYQGEKHIERCVESVEKQTFKDFELLLLDDGSSDNSYSICLKQQEKYSNIRVFHHENHGQAYTRNKGADYANGEYLLFLDVDDAVSSSILEKINKRIVVDASDTILYKYYFVDEQNNKKEIFMKFPNIPTSGEYALKQLLNQNLRSFVSLSCKRALFNSIRFPEGRVYEDTGTIYKILGNSKKVSYINNPLYFYYQNSASTTHNFTEKHVMDILKNVDEQEHYIHEVYPLLEEDFNVYKLLILSNCYYMAIKSKVDNKLTNIILLNVRSLFTIQRCIKQRHLRDVVRTFLLIFRR